MAVGVALMIGAVLVSLTNPASAAAERSISGKVVGDAHKVLPGVRVTLTGVLDDSVRAVVTGTDGSWDVLVPDGRYYIEFTDPQGIYLGEKFDNHLERRGVFRYRQVAVSGRDVPSVEAQLVRLATVSGRALDGQTPVADARVSLDPVIAGDPRSRTRAGPDGAFILSDVAPGTYRLTVTDPVREEGVPTKTVTTTVTVASGDRLTLPDSVFWRDSDRGALAVDAGDDRDKLASSDVDIWSIHDPVTPVAGVSFGPVGAPVGLANLVPGRYRISTGANTWQGGTSFENATTYTVRAGETTRAAVKAVDQIVLSGHVNNDRGQALRGALVLVRRMDDPQTIVASAVSFEDPGFRFEGLPKTRYSLTAVHPGGSYRTTTVNNIDPEYQVVTMPHVPKLPKIVKDDNSGTFVATVSGARPAEYAILYRTDDGDVFARGMELNPGGLLQHAPPGTYKVRIGEHSWYGGRSFSTAKTITLSRGKTTQIEVGSTPTHGDLVGEAVTAGGSILHRAFATAYAADNPREVIGRVPVNGTFRFDGLPVRAYKIRISDPLGRYATRWLGGGASFASAKAVTPDISEERFVGTTTVPVTFAVVTPPKVRGTARVGKVLTATDPKFTRSGVAIRRAWYRDGRKIRGATWRGYRLVAADAGHRIRYRVEAWTRGENILIATSPATRRVVKR